MPAALGDDLGARVPPAADARERLAGRWFSSLSVLAEVRGRWPHDRTRRRSLIAWSPLATRLVAKPSADRSNVRPGELSVRVERSHRVLVLSVRGEIDLVSVPQLEEELRKAEASDAKRVVLDLADVEFMDSSGLHALLRAWQRFEQNRDPLALSRVSPQVRRLLELTGTDRIFGVEGRRELSAGRDVDSRGT